MTASTCVVANLIFDVGNVRRPTSPTLSYNFFNLRRSSLNEGGSELATDFWLSPTKGLSPGNLFY